MSVWLAWLVFFCLFVLCFILKQKYNYLLCYQDDSFQLGFNSLYLLSLLLLCLAGIFNEHSDHWRKRTTLLSGDRKPQFQLALTCVQAGLQSPIRRRPQSIQTTLTASHHFEGTAYKLDIRTGTFKEFLKAMTSFAEINTDILNINALVKRFGMSREAYWIQHNFSET